MPSAKVYSAEEADKLSCHPKHCEQTVSNLAPQKSHQDAVFSTPINNPYNREVRALLRPFLICGTCIVGGMCSAASLDALDLVLRLESTGFTRVTLYSDDAVDQSFDFLDAKDDVWGIRKDHTRFNVGDEISLSATLDEESGQFSPCFIGDFSCSNAFGQLGENTFSIGDGAGQTLWGDFLLSGGTGVGDKVSLATFSGDLSYERLDEGDLVSWDTYVLNFSVSRNNLEPVGSPQLASLARAAPSPVPVPPSLSLLFAGLVGLGFTCRRKNKAVPNITV